MPRSQQAKHAFSAGIRAPRLSLRSDHNIYTERDSYSEACHYLTNWIVTPQGGIQFREGFKNFGSESLSSDPTQDSRIFQYTRGGDVSDYCVHVTAGDNLIHFMEDGAMLADTVAHDYLLAELESIRFTNKEKIAVLCHADHPPLFLKQALDGTISGDYISSLNVPYADYNDSDSPTASTALSDEYTCTWIDGSTVTWQDRGWMFVYNGVYATGNAGAIKVYDYTSTSADMITRLYRALSFIPELQGADTTYSVEVVGTVDATAIYKIIINGPHAGGKLEIIPTNDRYDHHVTVDNELTEVETLEPAWSFPTYVLNGSNYYQCIAPHVPASTNEPGVGVDEALYWTDIGTTKPDTFDWQYPDRPALRGTVSITAGTATLSGTGTAFGTDVAIGMSLNIDGEVHIVQAVGSDTSLTLATNHVAGATGVEYMETGNTWWADVPTGRRNSYCPGGRGFPTVPVFYQQRLWLMANPSMPVGCYGSRIGKYEDFQLGPQDDDPVFFAIDTSDTPFIRWAQAQRKMVIGTSSGDYSLNADITITPSNVQATKQNAGRSHGTDAICINTDIFYIQQGQEKLRKTAYDDNLQAQYSADVSLVAQHLFVPRAKRLALVQTPEVILYILREDGTLIGISYTPEQNAAAYFEVESQGTIIDICAIYNSVSSEDELYALVTYDGGTTRWIEKMPYPAREKTQRLVDADDALVDQGIVCLDGWISGTIVEGDNNVISGLDQFDGLTVSVLVDDAYTGDYTVTSGSVLLEAPDPGDVPAYSGTYAVGFSYDGYAKTFEMASGNPAGVGFGTKRKWTELWVRLLDSSFPKINGQLPSDRTPATPMSFPEIFREGIVDLQVNNLGYGDGSIEILQDRPYPCHVLGFFGKFEVENA